MEMELESWFQSQSKVQQRQLLELATRNRRNPHPVQAYLEKLGLHYTFTEVYEWVQSLHVGESAKELNEKLQEAEGVDPYLATCNSLQIQVELMEFYRETMGELRALRDPANYARGDEDEEGYRSNGFDDIRFVLAMAQTIANGIPTCGREIRNTAAALHKMRSQQSFEDGAMAALDKARSLQSNHELVRDKPEVEATQLALWQSTAVIISDQLSKRN